MVQKKAAQSLLRHNLATVGCRKGNEVFTPECSEITL